MDFWVILILHSSQLSVFLWSLIAILIFWIEMIWKWWNVSYLFHNVSSPRDLTVYCYCCGVLCTDCIGCYQPEWNPLLSWETTWREEEEEEEGGCSGLWPGVEEDVTPELISATQYQTHRHPASILDQPYVWYLYLDIILDISNCEIFLPLPLLLTPHNLPTTCTHHYPEVSSSLLSPNHD